jgi:transposase
MADGEPTKRRRTAAQLERQEKHFNMSVLDGLTYREIKAKTGASLETIVADIREEALRRADELGDRRESEKARSVAFYESIKVKALRKSELNDKILEKILAGEGGKVSDRSLEAALKAQERIDKIQGVDAPTKVDLGLQQLIDAINSDAD